MLTSVFLVAMLASADGTTAIKPKKASTDPNRIICKYSDEPGSRIQRRKICHTAAEWAERKRIEYQYLLENQRNAVK